MNKFDVIISGFLDGSIDAETFAREFEEEFNFGSAGSDRRPYQSLFDLVVRFSPFLDEVEQIPTYVGEDALRSAVSSFVAMGSLP